MTCYFSHLFRILHQYTTEIPQLNQDTNMQSAGGQQSRTSSGIFVTIMRLCPYAEAHTCRNNVPLPVNELKWREVLFKVCHVLVTRRALQHTTHHDAMYVCVCVCVCVCVMFDLQLVLLLVSPCPVSFML